MSTHRVKSGKHHRGSQVFRTGDLIDATDEELQAFPHRFESVFKRGRTAPSESEKPPSGKGTSEVEVFPRHVGGGYYLLSNGEKVRGKDAAEKAEAELFESGEDDG